VDSTGGIDVWTDYQQALGGGVMMYQCRAAHIYNNTMKFQNDGVALYHCDSIRAHDNDFTWNTSYGFRMFWTDSCYIYNNIASHINRPFTDPSDCSAILMIISNENRVENNDLSWSGDGIFLGSTNIQTSRTIIILPITSARIPRTMQSKPPSRMGMYTSTTTAISVITGYG
jgi:nitrous oxidase accessory protein NosD